MSDLHKSTVAETPDSDPREKMSQLECTVCATAMTIDVIVDYCPCCGASHGITEWENES